MNKPIGSLSFAARRIVAAMAPALLMAGACNAAERYEGTAYLPGTERVLYRETHWVAGPRHLVLYRCSDGKAFARKRIERAASAASPDFELVDARDGYREGVRTTPAGREVFSGAGNEVKRAMLAQPAAVIDAGFDAYLRGAWDRLSASAVGALSFVVPSRLRAMDFKVRRVGGSADRRSFRLSLGTWYGGMLPHIDVDYSLADRQLLRYRGIGNIRGANGGNLAVDLRFPPGRRRDAPASELVAATSEPLNGRCLL